MPDVVAPLETVTFTVTSVPRRSAPRKTIERLMRMQPELQKGLRKRARIRSKHENVVDIRAGRRWIHRVRASKLVKVQPGETFTLTLTPQIVPDVKSVERYLKAEKAR